MKLFRYSAILELEKTVRQLEARVEKLEHDNQLFVGEISMSSFMLTRYPDDYASLKAAIEMILNKLGVNIKRVPGTPSHLSFTKRKQA